ncbi:putative Ig domain-containing protein [Cellulomonas sp. S1-8]|uniref:RCC1 domain-containing protein n=1 Tax=Cellulomonas sp. S1-8 TaxID=2904790 RepID=UPI00224310B8|nr:putative Ig domain-containing protein [Cellulomonas sp. S1-8]UZN03453.1 putative Ig domain-containing protein [Cellulomonas sp. S1-8]
MHPRTISSITAVAVLTGLLAAAPPAAAVPTPAGDVTITPDVGSTAGGDPLRFTVPGAAWAAVAGGGRHTLGLARDGAVYAWGEGSSGQLGTGSTADSPVPVRVDVPLPDGVTISAVSAGADFSLALASDGTLWAWGANAQGQLGLGTTDAQPEPRQVPLPIGVERVDAGGQFVVALDTDRRVWTWGANDAGQLGVGDRQPRTSPVPMPQLGSSGPLEDITAGHRHAFALVNHNEVFAWGDNSYGQLGADVGARLTVPTAVWGGGGCCTGTSRMFAVGDSTFTYGAPDELVAFGRNDRGQLGIGLVSRSAPATRVAFPDGALLVEEVVGGAQHVVATTLDGTVWVWGDDQLGQLGTAGTATLAATPVPLLRDAPDAAVAAGEASTFVVVDGGVAAAGQNASGELGDGSTTTRPTPVDVRTPLDVVGVRVGDVPAGAVARGAGGTFATVTPPLPDGVLDVVLETRDAAGAAGPLLLLEDAYTATATPPPTFVTTAYPVAAVDEPYAFVPELRGPGPITFTSGDLPPGLVLDPATGALSGTPTQVGDADVQITATNAYGSTTLTANLRVLTPPALSSDPLPAGAVGRAYRGTLSLADEWPWRPAVRVTVTAGALPDGLGVRTVLARDGAIVVEVAGTPTTAGAFTFTLTTTSPVPRSVEQTITIGVSPQVTSPVPPSGTVGAPYTHTFTGSGSDVAFVVAAGSLPPGLTLDPVTGTLAGTPTTAGRWDVVVAARTAFAQEATDVVLRIVGPGLSAPVTPAVGPVQGGTTVSVATPSPRFSQITTTGTWTRTATLGLTADGYVWAWGDGAVPLLSERGEDVDPTLPVRLALPLEPGVKVTQLASGSASYVLASDGTVRHLTADPATPTGTRVTTVPLTLPAGVRVTGVAAGADHALALASDGSVWAWGANDQNQLGDGTATERATPVRVAFPAGVRVRSVSASHDASLAADTAGRIWTWGVDVAEGCALWDECEPVLHGVPTRVAAPAALVATRVVVAQTAALAIGSDGSLWSWGGNWYGELGRSGGDSVPEPVELERPPGVTTQDVALAREGGVAVLSDGTVWRWGRVQCYIDWTQDFCGRFDDDGVYERPTRVTSPVDQPAARVAACVQCGLVLTTTGAVWGWGANDAGQLGDGTRVRRPDPVAVPAPFTVSGITFDGVAARLTGSPANAVATAVTPAHATGAVDVVVTTRRPDGSPGPSVRYSGAFTYGAAPPGARPSAVDPRVRPREVG